MSDRTSSSSLLVLLLVVVLLLFVFFTLHRYNVLVIFLVRYPTWSSRTREYCEIFLGL